jgi:hypothetical protein
MGKVNTLVPATPVMPSSNVHNLVALATDVLAQSEARQRAARRLQHAVDHLTESIRQSGAVDPHDRQKLRDHSKAIRDLGDVERNLLDEFDAALTELR